MKGATLFVVAMLCLFGVPVVSEASSTVFFSKPCRVLDTRNASPGDTASLSFKVRGNPAPGGAQGGTSGCGVPDHAEGVILNVTVVNPAGSGHAILWPTDQAMPATSTIVYSALTNNNDGVNTRIASLPATSGDISIASSAAAHWVVDLTGFQTRDLRQRYVTTITNAPHAVPGMGDTFLIVNGVGVFAGHDDEIAMWNGTSYSFDPPQDGDLAYEAPSGVYLRYKATGAAGWKLLDCDCPP